MGIAICVDLGVYIYKIIDMRWLLLLIFSSCLARAEIITFVAPPPTLICPTNGDPCYAVGMVTNTIAVSSNEVITIMNYTFDWVKIAREADITWINLSSPPPLLPPLTLAGPLSIRLEGGGLFTYKLAPKEDPIQPGTGVVIPSDATGPVEIILESSADLVSWTASVPGIYGANTTNRFFRVRAVRR